MPCSSRSSGPVTLNEAKGLSGEDVWSGWSIGTLKIDAGSPGRTRIILGCRKGQILRCSQNDRNGVSAMFRPVDSRQSFPEMEKGILPLWRERDVFRKSIESRPEGE